MTIFNDPAVQAVLHWLAHGLSGASIWQIVAYTLVLTHITIASVTIFLHRHQAHKALDLHPVASHFFRFWLWLTTGMITREWAAIHRKHHAKCEQAEDPHSPKVYGLRTVLLQGSELYRKEAKNEDTLRRYGHGTPNDWVERNVYSRYVWQGVGLMLIINLALFGALGLTVWAIQMIWIPITAAGIINGLGHAKGYRNFESSDTSTNLLPWGILIGGEELHNNHHTYPTSAKLSVKSYEFDLGWLYIRALSAVGLANVKKIPPRIGHGAVRPVADDQTLEALIAHRYEIMAVYAKEIRKAWLTESRMLELSGSVRRAGRRWLHRDESKVPAQWMPPLRQALMASPVVEKMLGMRQELQQIWRNTTHTREQLVQELNAWCQRADQSGVAALRELSLLLRTAKASARTPS